MTESPDLIFDRSRSKLTAIAYRMMGTVMDAEDVVQDAFLRWSKTDRTTVDEPERYLSAIVTRLSIDLLRSRKKERETYEGPWLPEPLVEPSHDHVELAESLSTAFLLMLERLGPAERAVSLLREVFDYGYDEIAVIVERSEANCRQMVKRARDRIAEGGRNRFVPEPGQHQRLTENFLKAAAKGDMEGLMGVLAEDVSFRSDHGGKVSAARRILRRPDTISRFILGLGQKSVGMRVDVKVATINGEMGVAFYLEGELQSVWTFEVVEGRIAEIYVVLNPEKLGRAKKALEDCCTSRGKQRHLIVAPGPQLGVRLEESFSRVRQEFPAPRGTSVQRRS
tara:strand:- start:4959 stop:5972 length:1014 start_codon:yes stop_codon:yes gene_type:complete